ncbi:MAG: U32 family peptidase [Alphaproteobacteria bacterium]|nr:U32 family peptidase [Alphaproteobacteria bacterium]
MAVSGALTLGPLLYNWPAARARDFYLRVADEMDVDRVYFGEVVCSKRQPLHAGYAAEVLERLLAAGKQVVFSTLALVTNKKEIASMKALCADREVLVELNDLTLLETVSGKPFAVGPYVNVYNEGTLRFLEEAGASIVTPPFELPRTTLGILAAQAASELEVQVFGRMPLAISARCYHARAFHLHKDGCQFVCDRHEDGMEVNTLDGQQFLTVNGTQTQSRTYGNLIQEIPDLQSLGITSFRLSPQSGDMVGVARVFRAVQKGETAPGEGLARLSALASHTTFSNGFYHAATGRSLHSPQLAE